LISGVINLIPAILVFFPNKIGESYGIEMLNPNYELLLRHRAMLSRTDQSNESRYWGHCHFVGRLSFFEIGSKIDAKKNAGFLAKKGLRNIFNSPT